MDGAPQTGATLLENRNLKRIPKLKMYILVLTEIGKTPLPPIVEDYDTRKPRFFSDKSIWMRTRIDLLINSMQ